MIELQTALPVPNQMVENNPQPQSKVEQPSEAQNWGFRRVMLATVTPDDRCDMFYVHSLCESAKALLANNIALAQTLYGTTDGAAMAYNQAITDAWRNEFDGLVIVSPDVAWEPQALYDAISTGKDCVALPVAGPEGFKVGLGEIARLQRDEKTGEIKVLSASLDFLYLSAKTLKELCDTNPSINLPRQGTDVKAVIQGGDCGGALQDEWQVLHSKLVDIPVEIWLNPKHSVVSRAKVPFAADFSQVLKEAGG